MTGAAKQFRTLALGWESLPAPTKDSFLPSSDELRLATRRDMSPGFTGAPAFCRASRIRIIEGSSKPDHNRSAFALTTTGSLSRRFQVC